MIMRKPLTKYSYTSNSVQDTIDIAYNFALNLVGGETVLLCGQLGAGKTHFVKGIAAALAVEETITSPTFTLHNSYKGRLALNHFDFYRIDDSEEVLLLGLDEYFCVDNSVAVIEWYSKVASLLPTHCWLITIDKTGANSRNITIEQL